MIFFQVRHGPSFYNCGVKLETSEDGYSDIAIVHLSEDDQGLAAGQYAAFYQVKTCLGSGVILDSWDNLSFPVCAKALEIAKLQDKSKLGKPVKIKVRKECSPINSECADDIEVHGKSMDSLNATVGGESQRVMFKGMLSNIELKWWQKLREWLRIF